MGKRRGREERGKRGEGGREGEEGEGRKREGEEEDMGKRRGREERGKRGEGGREGEEGEGRKREGEEEDMGKRRGGEERGKRGEGGREGRMREEKKGRRKRGREEERRERRGGERKREVREKGVGESITNTHVLSPCSEDYKLENAAFQIIRGGVVPMDLATVHLADGTSTYMTLLAAWGMVADIDIESEKFRKIGKTRFILGELLLLLYHSGYILSE